MHYNKTPAGLILVSLALIVFGVLAVSLNQMLTTTALVVDNNGVLSAVDSDVLKNADESGLGGLLPGSALGRTDPEI